MALPHLDEIVDAVVADVRSDLPDAAAEPAGLVDEGAQDVEHDEIDVRVRGHSASAFPACWFWFRSNGLTVSAWSTTSIAERTWQRRD
ncbi:hypothetical protein [Georgenia halophila]|uniref:hypothetical protein n=1 Tax=Georgenia halophila TaxID=620889 RepID=UPI0031F09064